MRLKKGILLYSNLSDINSQIQLNTGVVKAISNNDFVYNEPSYLPNNIWRDISETEKMILINSKSTNTIDKSIRIGNIAEPLKELFVELGLNSTQSVEEVVSTLKSKEELIKNINLEINDYLKEISLDGIFKFHKITRALPNQTTVTCHRVEDKLIYIGMHIDRSKQFSPYTAYQSGNRISINLSNEDRALLYINLSLRQIVNLLKQKNITNVTTDNIVELFFKNYSNYPVVKLILKPYQYYIAPTDNFIHDASTLGNKGIDVTIVYTGKFSTSNNNIWN